MKHREIRQFRHVLRQFSRLLHSQLRTCCSEVTLAQCLVLLEIEEIGTPTMGQLAANLRLDNSTLSRTVDGLVAQGVGRAGEDDDNDRRVVKVRLTEEGEAVCRSIHADNDASCRRVFDKIPPVRAPARHRGLRGPRRGLPRLRGRGAVRVKEARDHARPMIRSNTNRPNRRNLDVEIYKSSFALLLLTLPWAPSRRLRSDEPESSGRIRLAAVAGPFGATRPRPRSVSSRNGPRADPRSSGASRWGTGYSGVAVSAGKLYTMWDEKGGPAPDLPRRREREVAVEHARGRRLPAPLRERPTLHAPGRRRRRLRHRNFREAPGRKPSQLGTRSGSATWWRSSGPGSPVYGYASSPLVVGDRLLVETAGEDAAYSALDKRTASSSGAPRTTTPAYSSPMLATLGRRRPDPVLERSGAPLRRTRHGEGAVELPVAYRLPILGGSAGDRYAALPGTGQLFLSSGSGTAVLHDREDRREFGVDTDWESRVLRNDINSSLLLGHHVYGFDGGTLKCIDVRDGQGDVAKRREYRKGSLIAADGQLIVLGEGGELALVEASPELFVEKSSAPVLEGKELDLSDACRMGGSTCATTRSWSV